MRVSVQDQLEAELLGNRSSHEPNELSNSFKAGVKEVMFAVELAIKLIVAVVMGQRWRCIFGVT